MVLKSSSEESTLTESVLPESFLLSDDLFDESLSDESLEILDTEIVDASKYAEDDKPNIAIVYGVKKKTDKEDVTVRFLFIIVRRINFNRISFTRIFLAFR
jgi:hypothetical protein